MAAADTETVCDFDIDYVAHTIKIQIGSTAEIAENSGFVRFEQSVDFNELLTTTSSSDDAAALASTFFATLFCLFALKF